MQIKCAADGLVDDSRKVFDRMPAHMLCLGQQLSQPMSKVESVIKKLLNFSAG